MSSRARRLALVCLLAGCSAGVDSPDPAREPGRESPPRITGSLAELVRNAPGIQQRRCAPLARPSPDELEALRQGLRYLLGGDVAQARERLEDLDFELFELQTAGPTLWVVREQPRVAGRGWGLYALNPRPARPLLLQAPHPVHDFATGVQAAQLAVQLGARGFALSTTFRCATAEPSRCSGTSAACRQSGRFGRYLQSDVAHVTESMFHAAHEALLDSDPTILAVQIHGFSRRPGWRRHIIVSDGTRLPGRRASFSNRLARLIRRRLPRRLRRTVRSCNERNNASGLCGVQNVQGRHANGSPEPCTRPPRRSRNRFLHVEQSRDARLPGGEIEPRLLLEALGALWAPADPAATERTCSAGPSWARSLERRSPSGNP